MGRIWNSMSNNRFFCLPAHPAPHSPRHLHGSHRSWDLLLQLTLEMITWPRWANETLPRILDRKWERKDSFSLDDGNWIYVKSRVDSNHDSRWGVQKKKKSQNVDNSRSRGDKWRENCLGFPKYFRFWSQSTVRSYCNLSYMRYPQYPANNTFFETNSTSWFVIYKLKSQLIYLGHIWERKK